MEENALVLSEELLSLLKSRREIRADKIKAVKNQRYEEAARTRDQERQNCEHILNLLKKEMNYDFSQSKQVETDILMILDLLEEGDLNYYKALDKLDAEDLERLRLMKDIQNYNLKQITLDELHESVKSSFRAVRLDVKKQIEEALIEAQKTIGKI
jgi:hypothetical protein